MPTKSRKALEEEFIAAEGSEAVLDAFLALLPSEDQCFEEASSNHPKKFVAKLKDIGSSARVISDAVSEYAGAKLMRMRCEKRRFPKARFERMDKNLLGIYDSVNDTLETRELTAEEEAKRGRLLLDSCRARAENVRLEGFTIDEAIAKGELQCIANGEGFVEREISWKRK